MRPGVLVTVEDAVPPRSAPTDVDTWFAVGITEKGRTDPKLVRSMADFERQYGKRIPDGILYDCMDAYFREGGAKAYVGRVIGDAATTAKLDVEPVTFKAQGEGTWGNNLKLAVVDGLAEDSIQVLITDATTTKLLEASPEFLTKADLLAWQGQYVYVEDKTPATTTLPPATASAPLAGGADDYAGVDDASWSAALDKLSTEFGPGQVSAPGETTSAMHKTLLQHAYDKNRVALLDAPDNSTAAGLISAALTVRSDPNARYGAMFTPRVLIPGVVPNTTREVPYSPIQAGLIARSFDQLQPAAGVNGISRVALDVKYAWTDEERYMLNEGGVDVARLMSGTVRTYGYRTLVDPYQLPQWVQLNTVRVVMAVKAQCEVVGESHIFRIIDGRGIEISAFHADLVAVCIPFYEQNALYGATPAEAFAVDTGPSINTPETIAAGELHANIKLRTSPFSEYVEINIIKVPLPATGQDASLVS